jgi:hypothetical protein
MSINRTVINTGYDDRQPNLEDWIGVGAGQVI